ncbi:uncharacterized protein METZ01_LOCUS300610, partial [marine metagenome]
MASRPIHTVFFLPNASSYLDRIHMLNEVSELTGKVTLVLGRNDVPYDFPKSDALKFVDAKFVRGWRPLNLWRAAKTLSNVGPVDVIHDTFGNFFTPFL